MGEYDDYEPEDDAEQECPPDPRQEKARDVLAKFFESHPGQVYFSRQLEVIHERQFFYWVTNRALRDLLEAGQIRG